MLDTDELRRAFGTFMTGVTVVTTTDKHNTPVGFTANSFTSVSMDPPLLLVCPGKHVASYDVFNTTTHFAISVLAEEQEAISNNFASGPEDRFSNVNWYRDANGCPLIEDVCATFSCQVHQRHDAGDHMILVGEILQFQRFQRAGLGYSSNGYFNLSREQQADTSSDSTAMTGVIIKYKDKVLVLEKNNTLALPTIEQADHAGARSAMQNYLQSIDPRIQLGTVYSIYDDSATNRHYTFFLAHTDTDIPGNTPGEFVPIANLQTEHFPDNAQALMMSRFVTEVRNKAFGLYIGDVESGDVHHP